MEKEDKLYVCEHLKSMDEYHKELLDIHRELEVGIATDTLIESDLELLQRADELVIILDFLKRKNMEQLLKLKKEENEDGTTESEKE